MRSNEIPARSEPAETAERSGRNWKAIGIGSAAAMAIAAMYLVEIWAIWLVLATIF